MNKQQTLSAAAAGTFAIGDDLTVNRWAMARCASQGPACGDLPQTKPLR